jgi:asparagine synthase (glutamine-hydrolysing)
VEYAFSLPSSYLLRDGWHKWILRKALKDILPTDVLWRKRKMGFPFPYERFFKRSSPIIAIILKQANNPFIDLTQVHEIQNNWRALSFILWYEMFFNENKSLFDTISDTGRKMEGEADYGFKPEFLKSSVYEI